MNESTGMVGAFWVLSGHGVIGERCSLAAADQRGGYYNGQTGHHWLWPNLIKPTYLAGRSYTTVPRGRVVYHPHQHLFMVFAATEIVRDAHARRAVECFYQLMDADQTRWTTDPHYVTQLDLVDEGDDFPEV